MLPLLSMENFKGRQPRPGSSLADIFCSVGCVAREKIRREKKRSVKHRTLGVDEVDDHDKGFQFGKELVRNSSKGKELLVPYIPYSVGTVRRERSSVRANYITSSADSGLTKRKRNDGGELGEDSSLRHRLNKMKIKEEKRLGIKNPKEHNRAQSYSTNPNDLPEKVKRKTETAEGIEISEKVKTKELDSPMGKELVVSPLYSVGTKTSSDSESHHEKSGVTKKKKNKKKSVDGNEDDKDLSLKCKAKDMKRPGVRRPHIRAPRYSTNPNDLPEELKRKIETLEGIESFEKARMVLVIEKHLFITDITKSANRLSMPLKQITPESFLDEDEIKYLAAQKNWQLSVISPLLEEEDLTLKQWNMTKDNGSVSSSYVLKTHWNAVRKKNGLKQNDLVQVWSFRDVGNNLYFALVLAEKATNDGGAGSNGDGCSLPSTSPSTASPSNNEHGGEKSSCDIAEGEETREQNENCEIKYESSSESRRSSTPSSNDHDGEKRRSDISEEKETGEQDENCDEIRDESSTGSRRSSTPSNNDHDGEKISSDISEGKETGEQDENRDEIRGESSNESERSSPPSCDNVI